MNHRAPAPHPQFVVEAIRYGRIERHLINPSDYTTPTLVAELAGPWTEVCAEVPGAVVELGSAVRSFARHVGDQLKSVETSFDFGLKNLRLRHLDSWEIDRLKHQSIDRTDTPYRNVVYFFSLLRRIGADNPGLLHPLIENRLTKPTRLSHLRNGGTADHPDSEIRRIRSAAHRIVYQARIEAANNTDFLPLPHVMVALHILMSLTTGHPPEVLRSVALPDLIVTPVVGGRALDVDESADERLTRFAKGALIQTLAVTYTKTRAGIMFDDVYDRARNRAIIRTFAAALELTENARKLTTDRSLLLTVDKTSVGQVDWRTGPANLGKWYFKYVQGEPIQGPFRFSRLRKVTLRKEVLADPVRYLRDGRRHTSRTLFASYTNSAVLRAEAGKLLVGAISDYFALAIGPTVVTPGAEELLRQGLSVEGLNAETGSALLGGRLNGALTACRDPENSPHAEAGKVCPVSRSGSCFTCANAIITQEHLPAVILLKEVSDPNRQSDEALWQQAWEPTFRMTSQILTLFPKQAVDEAAERIGSVPIDLGIRNGQRGEDQ